MIRFARVVGVHPERRTLDLVDLNSGERMSEATYLGAVGSASGTWDVPASVVSSDQNAPSAGANLIAAYDFTDFRQPVVVGFARPSGSILVFTQQDRTITRHDSGTYTTIAPDGSFEVWHVSGAYFRIGTGPHEDLTPLAANSWPAASGPAPTVTLATPTFSLAVTPAGDATMSYNSLTLNGPVTMNGDITQTGSIVSTGDHVAGGKSLEHHTHNDSTGHPTSQPL